MQLHHKLFGILERIIKGKQVYLSILLTEHLVGVNMTLMWIWAVWEDAKKSIKCGGLPKRGKFSRRKIILEIDKVVLYWIYWYALIYIQILASYTKNIWLNVSNPSLNERTSKQFLTDTIKGDKKNHTVQLSWVNLDISICNKVAWIFL